MAPRQSEPPFKLTPLVFLIVFLALTTVATKRFPSEQRRRACSVEKQKPAHDPVTLNFPWQLTLASKSLEIERSCLNRLERDKNEHYRFDCWQAAEN